MGAVSPPEGREYVQVAMGTIMPFGMGVGCGLLSDGSVECWGNPPVTDTPSGAFVQIDGHSNSFCGLREDGSGECWHGGSDLQHFPDGVRFRQISVGGLFVCGVTVDGQLACWGAVSQPIPVTESVRMVSVGDRHACALLEDGLVECFGELPSDYQGAPPDQTFELVDAGFDNDCAITAERHLWCWGSQAPAREMRDAAGQPLVLKEP
jgi:hypothetical protein